MPKLSEIYNSVVDAGTRNDPRGVEEIKNTLNRESHNYDKLSEKEKKVYDAEKLSNPYSDTRILFGDKNAQVAAALVGIDIETPELLLANSLRASGKKVDLVISHHPEGRAYAKFYEVMGMQSDILSRNGVPINVAESLMSERQGEVSRKVAPVNHQRAVDAAKLIKLPFMCAHTPADNMVATYLTKLFARKSPQYLGDALDLIKEIPEYTIAGKESSGPFILVGDKDKKAGKIFVDITGGTESSKNVFTSMQVSGIGTIVGMHMSEEHYKKAKENHINVIIAGHISSDNLGLNLLFDEVAKKVGGFAIIECSGFRRVKR